MARGHLAGSGFHMSPLDYKFEFIMGSHRRLAEVMLEDCIKSTPPPYLSVEMSVTGENLHKQTFPGVSPWFNSVKAIWRDICFVLISAIMVFISQSY